MSKIIGNITATPVPRSDWNQNDATKADFIKNKPELGTIAEKNANDYYTKDETGLCVDTAVDGALKSANKYTDDEIALLLNNSSTAVDSIMELAKAMEENETVVDALEEAVGKKADKEHNHDTTYYTKTQIDSYEFITVDDIDEICGVIIE